MTLREPHQGEIWYANLDPIRGSEQGGMRPVVIISGETLNAALPIVIACPLTTKIKTYPGCVRIQPTKKNGLQDESEVLTFQIRSLTRRRLAKRIGSISRNECSNILRALYDVLVL